MSDVLEVSALEAQVVQDNFTGLRNATKNDTVGASLSSSRESKGWSIQFVAEQLKLSQGQILALEENRFENLPKLVIVRGFVRAYAKLLKIDADGLVALLPKDETPVQLETSLRPALSTPFIDSRSSLLGQHDTNRRYMLGAFALLALIVVFLAVQKFDLVNVVSQMITKKAPEVTEVNAVPNGVVPTLEPIVQTSTSTEVPLNSAAQKSEDPIPNDQLSANVPAAVSTPVEQVAPAPTAQVAATDTNATVASLPPMSELLTIKFRQDSWIYVKTEKGIVLSSHLAKAGTEESFSVKQALYLKIGNAAGVEAVLRGEPMAVLAERGSNVANLTVK